MKYVFDIDNTILSTKGNDYQNSVPIQHRINYVNKLYNEDNYIVLYTGRGTRSGVNYEDLTRMQMEKYGVKYHELIMGKMDYDYFVDDKAVSLKELDSIISLNKSSSNYKSSFDSGYNFDDYKRFQSLKSIKYKSVLDIGSGPCMLLRWLKNNQIKASYEAMDIREDALSECDCQTHNNIDMTKKYDLVCLFGVSDYFKTNEDEKKEEFLNLLTNAVKKSKKYVIYSLMRKDNILNKLVKYSLDEAKSVAAKAGLEITEIDLDSEPTEYIITCTINKEKNVKKTKKTDSKPRSSKGKKKSNDSHSVI